MDRAIESSDEQRGWSDTDLQSVLAKLSQREMFTVSEREMRAHMAWMKARGEKSVFSA